MIMTSFTLRALSRVSRFVLIFEGTSGDIGMGMTLPLNLWMVVTLMGQILMMQGCHGFEVPGNWKFQFGMNCILFVAESVTFLSYSCLLYVGFIYFVSNVTWPSAFSFWFASFVKLLEPR